MRARATDSRITSLMSRRVARGVSFFKNSRIRRITSLRPISVPDDKIQGFFCLMELWCFGFEPTEAGFRVGDNTGQRLVHFMRNGRCQFTHCQCTADSSEFRFHFLHRRLDGYRALSFLNVAPLLLYPFSVGDVPRDFGCAHNLAALIDDRRYSELDFDHRTVFAAANRFIMFDALRRDGCDRECSVPHLHDREESALRPACQPPPLLCNRRAVPLLRSKCG